MYCSILKVLLLLVLLHNISGAVQNVEELVDVDPSISVKYNLKRIEEANSEKTVLRKRQIYFPFGTQTPNLQNVFGSLCGILVYCNNPLSGYASYDYYDYGFGVFAGFGGFGGFGAFGGGTAWPFSFLGGGFFG